MPLSVNTLEATDIQSNQMTLNGELIDIGNYDIALCYFEYGQKADLSDSVKSTKCALLDNPGTYFFIQDNIDDNSVYYYKSVVQNFEGTEIQNKYLKNIDYINSNFALFDNIAMKNGFTYLFSNKDIIYYIFSNNDLSLIWDGDDYSIGNNYVRIVITSYSGEKQIELKNNLDLTNYNTLNIDWLNNGYGSNSQHSYVLINNSIVLNKTGTFSRRINSIDISTREGLASIAIKASSRNGFKSRINVYGLWLE